MEKLDCIIIFLFKSGIFVTSMLFAKMGSSIKRFFLPEVAMSLGRYGIIS
jgi:hypothetical protein